MPGVQLVSYLRGCTGCTWVPHQLSVGEADKTVQTLSQLQSSPASHCISSYLVQSVSLLQTMPIHPSRSSMMSSQARLPICETARQTRRQPSARSTSVKLEESAFCILEAWRGVRGKHEHVSHAHIKAIEVAQYNLSSQQEQ